MKLEKGYKLPRDTGEVDGEGSPIYVFDLLHVEETTANGKQLKRVGREGKTQSCNLKTDSSVDVFHGEDLVATWQIIPQWWDTNHWEIYTKLQDSINIVDGHLVAEGSDANVSWNLDIAWTERDKKFEINIDAPGYTFCGVLNIIFTTLGQEMIAAGTLVLDYSDYPGETSDDEGIVERNIIFEPDGVNDFLSIDPYLSILEEATETYVYGNSWSVRIRHTVANSIWVTLYDNAGNGLWGFNIAQVYSSVTYSLGYDITKQVTLLENTSTRVRIKVSGEIQDSSQVNLTNSVSVAVYFTFEPDKFFVRVVWVTDGEIAIGNTANNKTIGYYLDAASLTAEAAFYEDSESETSGTGTQDLANYLLMTSDEINIQLIGMYWTDTSSYTQRIDEIESHLLAWNDHATFPAGTHVMVGMIGLDATSAYSTADRLIIGNQYHDLPNDPVFPDITDSKGAFVTDLNEPDMLVTNEPIASDGAYQIDVDATNHDAKLMFGQSEIKSAIILLEPTGSIRSGSISSPTEHRLLFWDCDSDTLNVGTGSVTKSGADYLSDGKRGKGVDIQSGDTVYFQSLNNIVAAQGGINFDFTCTGTATANARFFQHSSATDEFQLYWTSATVIAGHINQVAISFTVDIDPLDSDLHNNWLCWDTADGIVWLIIDGRVFIDYVAISAPDFSSGNLYIGSASAGGNELNGIVDNVKIYTQPIVPGSSIPGNLDSYSDAHSTITMYSDDGSTLRIGSTSVNDISNIANDDGSISFQVDPSALSADETLFSAGTDFHIKYIHADLDILFTYGTATLQTIISIPSGLVGKHHILVRYKDTTDEIITLEVDGVRYTATSATAPTLGASIAWSVNVNMIEKAITDNEGTPQLLTAYGAPLHVSQITKE